MAHRLYIRHHINEIPAVWWERFEKTLPPREYMGGGFEDHIRARRERLRDQGAELYFDSETGVPYLKFTDAKDAALFLLKWS